jgi:hypothetical protein
LKPYCPHHVPIECVPNVYRMKVSFYLDKRKGDKGGRYPLKLQLAGKVGEKIERAYYPTGLMLKERQWLLIKKGRGQDFDELREWDTKLLGMKARALGILDNEIGVSFDSFDAIWTGKSVRNALVKALYQERIATLLGRGYPFGFQHFTDFFYRRQNISFKVLVMFL